MMNKVSYTINEKWFEDIKNEVKVSNAYYYHEAPWTYRLVDFDMEAQDEEKFENISKKLGWIV